MLKIKQKRFNTFIFVENNSIFLDQKLHILFLCGWYPSRVFPTNGDFIQRHAEAVAMRHKVTVLHLITDKNAIKNISYFTKNSGNLTVHIGYIKKTNALKKVILFIKAFFFLLKKISSVDIIHLNEIYPFGLFSLYLNWTKSKTPYIISEHWTGFLKEKSYKMSFFKKNIAKLICLYSDFVCPVSEKLKEDMISLGLKGKFRVIGNVIDTSIFYPKLEKKHSNFQIVHVSNFNDTQKNITGLLKTAKKLEAKIENFNFIFIGSNEKKFENTIKNLSFKKGTLTFINHLSQKELVFYLQNASLYISFSNYETFGIVTLEAISCGTFVISTDTGILPELPQKDFFKVIPIAEEKILYNSILDIYNNPPIVNIEEMHYFVESKFSKEAISATFSNLYYKAKNNNDAN